MAPGPMGQCFPVPDDDDIKQQMIRTAENQQKIYRMYNFDYNTQVTIDARPMQRRPVNHRCVTPTPVALPLYRATTHAKLHTTRLTVCASACIA